ncbi:putative HECT domain, armadillo-like helical, HECT, E3 ligase catalytic domain-containing protein [Helianthus annuus]|uniref:HECT-type E3 ubiquitin transferase n=1 Tax=Helianthus annuus TaxID=4232 RepID=A0A251TKH8_HELAN|nr:E3 ubiquitin-protein ligase UPL3 isoform X2 [Helianthus annuus]KAF5786287.1 putative HECT domain, armadillo-like helical, HECT, E3 ligase catalytic domain-containing protein [Helianthus annuus]KAJ0513725.1 putative HECT domain, armadillo-like helical, HECT, E3 ligase catalytic domain-containing protein [Helianthus annuus]KAJ0529829.1 putative HECT domain, armadillo-like helical, HECT, E3 ligase catalytic domain-containing protein [Helianthus annuus]KAJ0696703.1 putative HECT domain, armadill
METRSRKRAEATSSAHSSSSSGGPTTRSNKRTRLSTGSSSASAVAVAGSNVVAQSVSTRLRSSNMDNSVNESGSGSGRGRRSRKNVGNQGLGLDRDNLDKGKEKEHEVRVKERDNVNRENNLGLNIDGGGGADDDEDDDSEGGGVGILHQNLTSASSALQGLLRKLGAGLDDLLPSSAMASASSSHQSGRLKKILSGLRADGEEGKQVEALTQLCEMLSIGTEDSLSTFSVDSFVPVLVGLLNHESNPDIMLLAARALTHLCDVLPSSCAAVVHYGAVSCFVARLLTIEYMDLAEQSLQALKKISQEHPTACLRAGALMAVLSYLDFFSTGVQRVALSTAANMCKKLPSDAADFVMEAVPLLTNLLQYHDAKVLEHASVCLTRIAEAFAASPDQLDELCTHGLVKQAASLISTSCSGGGQASLSTSTYTGLIRLLSTCASGSPLGSKTLLLLGISGIVKDILSGSGLVATMSVSPALSRPPEQIFEIVNLANELLPPLPNGTITLPTSSNVFVKGSLLRKSTAGSGSKQEESGDSALEISAREKLLTKQPELLQQFGMDLLPVLIQIYGSSVNAPVRHKCLSVIGKLMYFSTADMIQSLLGVANISSFLAGVLAWKDPQVLVPSLQIAEILMEKLPETFSKMFVREGVVHAIDTLAESSSPSDVNAAEDLKTSVELPAVSSSLRMAVSSSAKAFKDKYFPSDPGATTEVGVTDDLLHLKNLCKKLGAGVDDHKTKSKGKSKAFSLRFVDHSPGKEEDLLGVIIEMLAELTKDDGVSTFEFIGSGVVDALLNYFSCGHFSKERVSETNLPKLRQLATKRYTSFIQAALPLSLDAGKQAPMSNLVQKLQYALTSLERFPVVLSHSARSSTGNARLSSGLGALSQPFKLRLCRAHGEKSLRDYSSNVVLIDPLASLAAVEDFLWPRVQRSESGQKPSGYGTNSESGTGTTPAGAGASSLSTPVAATRHHSTRSRSSVNIGDSANKTEEKTASSSKGKGKAVLKSGQDEGRGGPQTRNAARRRASLDKDAQMKSVDGDSTSEDEDFDISPVEMDDALVIEDDDISEDDDEDPDDVLRDDSLPVCMPDKVHDVKLGEERPAGGATSDSQTNPGSSSSSRGVVVRGSDSLGSRGKMSFAAAAMAGLSSANGGRGGIRGGRDRHGRPLVGSPKLVFSSGGKQLNRHLTIYQAIQRQLVLDEDDDNGSDFVSSDGSRLWGDIYTITYQRADTCHTQTVGTPSSTTPSKSSTKAGSTSNSNSDSRIHQMSLLDSILQGELPCDLERNNPTYNILSLLRVLEGLNQLAPRLRVQSATDSFAQGKIFSLDELNISTGVRVPSDEFINSKLTPKLSRQIQDALALCSGSLPSWCYQLTKSCPFLFPFETRRQYFYSTAFGLSRALHRLQQQQGADGHGSMNEREFRVGRLQRQKVRVSRNRILDSAAKVMEMYSSQKAVLEVEYFGEVGTGLGPTLEFYTLLSHDLQKAGLRMWRSNLPDVNTSVEVDSRDKKSGKGLGDLILAPLGLFPRPWPLTVDTSDGAQFSKVIEHFRLLGRVMAKALQDGRLLDLPLSVAFYKLVLGQELDLHDISLFDGEFGKTLQELQALVCRKQYLESLHDQNEILNLRFRGAPVEDLCLDFTLPGYPDFVLKTGDDIVDINNLEEYISLVVEATVKTGITRQMEAFRAGFSQVFDISALQIFSPSELDYLLCGRGELWEADTLVEHIKFDHGYTSKSPPIVNLLEIMGEFNPEQQRAFCQFVTGAPRLPPGGLAVLNPKLTIVRKHSSTSNNAASNAAGVSESADDDLPSVMTCANYLKLPPYSTKEIMLKKLLYAINEGQGSFDLS